MQEHRNMNIVGKSTQQHTKKKNVNIAVDYITYILSPYNILY